MLAVSYNPKIICRNNIQRFEYFGIFQGLFTSTKIHEWLGSVSLVQQFTVDIEIM
jgi:hypothetical protein